MSQRRKGNRGARFTIIRIYGNSVHVTPDNFRNGLLTESLLPSRAHPDKLHRANRQYSQMGPEGCYRSQTAWNSILVFWVLKPWLTAHLLSTASEHIFHLWKNLVRLKSVEWTTLYSAERNTLQHYRSPEQKEIKIQRKTRQIFTEPALERYCQGFHRLADLISDDNRNASLAEAKWDG